MEGVQETVKTPSSDLSNIKAIRNAIDTMCKDSIHGKSVFKNFNPTDHIWMAASFDDVIAIFDKKIKELEEKGDND